MASLRYRALLLGNWIFPKDPELRRLRGPSTDLTVLKNALVHPTFGLHNLEDVSVAENLSAQDMRIQIQRFITSATPDHQILLYYSGHGKQNRGKLYLCASDTELSTLWATSVGAAEINNLLERSPAVAKVVVLDCCFSGNWKGAGEPVLPFNQGKGLAVLASSQVGAETEDAELDGDPSPFTRHLVAALQGEAADADGDGWITSEDAYQYVHHQMSADGFRPPSRTARLVGSVFIARASADVGILDKEGVPESKPTTHSPMFDSLTAVPPSGASVLSNFGDETFGQRLHRGSRPAAPGAGDISTINGIHGGRTGAPPNLPSQMKREPDGIAQRNRPARSHSLLLLAVVSLALSLGSWYGPRAIMTQLLPSIYPTSDDMPIWLAMIIGPTCALWMIAGIPGFLMGAIGCVVQWASPSASED